jgi:hypothetical protein
VVERGDEGSIQSAHDLVGKLVALVLEGLDLPPARRKICPVGEGPLEQAS